MNFLLKFYLHLKVSFIHLIYHAPDSFTRFAIEVCPIANELIKVDLIAQLSTLSTYAISTLFISTNSSGRLKVIISKLSKHAICTEECGQTRLCSYLHAEGGAYKKGINTFSSGVFQYTPQ